MASTPKLILTIQNRYPQMNPAMQNIASYIISSYENVIDMGIKDLAEACGVSVASVTRFVQESGFKTFRSFQVELVKMTKDQFDINSKDNILFQYGGASKDDSVCDVVKKVFTSNMRMLNDTLETLDYSLLEQVTEHILKARNLIFFGVGRSHIPVESARTRFYRIGFNCFSYNDPHEQIVAATSCTKQDIVFGISNYGRTASVVNSLLLAKEQGAITVGITSVANTPLANAVDYLFLTPYDMESRNQDRGYEPSCENTTQLVLLDAIYMSVALKQDKDIINQFFNAADNLEKERL